jgi:hypothetical protein
MVFLATNETPAASSLLRCSSGGGAKEEPVTLELTCAMGFRMERKRFNRGKIPVVSHKPIAAAAGLGHMAIHGNAIHAKLHAFLALSLSVGWAGGIHLR